VEVAGVDAVFNQDLDTALLADLERSGAVGGAALLEQHLQQETNLGVEMAEAKAPASEHGRKDSPAPPESTDFSKLGSKTAGQMKLGYKDVEGIQWDAWWKHFSYQLTLHPAQCNNSRPATEFFDYNRDGVTFWLLVSLSIFTLCIVLTHVPYLIIHWNHRATQAKSAGATLLSAFCILGGVACLSLPHVFKPARTVTVNLLVFLHFFVLPMVLQIPLVKINRFVSLGSLEETKATLVGATPLGSLRRAKSEYAESEFKLLAHKNGLALSAKHLWAFLPMGLAWGGYSLLWIFFIRCNASPGEGFNALLTIAHNLVLTLLLLITTVRALRGLQDVFSLRFELLALCNCTFLLLAAQLCLFTWLLWTEPNISFIWNSAYHTAALACLASMAICTLSLPIISMPSAPPFEKPGGLASKKLMATLEHPTSTAHFQAFLRANFLSEYYFFWRDVEEFRTLKPGTDLMIEAAKFINAAFVRPNAPLDVRLDYVQQLQVGHAIGSGVRPTMFDSVQDAVFVRMTQLYPLFETSIFAAECNDKLPAALPKQSGELRQGSEDSLM
jgi:hypothetical protein